MPINGIEWVSLVDYPGRICTTLFYGGCNLRCGFCHNVPLVRSPADLPAIDEDWLLVRLAQRRKLVTAICITGGEPTISPGLPILASRLKKEGYSVKLDTNGTQPRVLERLLTAGVLDYVAMDIKGPAGKYSAVAGMPVDLKAIAVSIDLIKSLAPAYEFRTTVVPGLLDENDIIDLCQQLGYVDKYVLQQFRPVPPLLDPQMERLSPYADEWLRQIATKLKAYAATVEVRC